MAFSRKTAKLNKAVLEGDWKTASALVAAGAEPSDRTRRHALKFEGTDWDDLLSSPGGSVTVDMTSQQKLYNAVLRGNQQRALELITEENAVPDAKMLDLAVRRLDESWTKLLADAIAQAGMPQPGNALYIAIKYGARAKTDILLAAGAVPNENAMRVAVYSSTGRMKKLLMKGGSATPEVLAEAVGRTLPSLGMVRAILKAGAIPDEETLKKVIVEKTDPGWADMLLEALVEAGGKPTVGMLKAAIEANKKDIAETILALGVVPDEEAQIAALAKLDTSWIKMMADALVAAGEKPSSKVLAVAVIADRGSTILIEAGAEPGEFLPSIATKAGQETADALVKQVEAHKAKQITPEYNKAAAPPPVAKPEPKLVKRKAAAPRGDTP